MSTANPKTIDEPEVLSPQQGGGHQDTTVEINSIWFLELFSSMLAPQIFSRTLVYP